MTPLDALAIVTGVEAMPVEHGRDHWGRPVVDLWWRLSPELPTTHGPRVGVVGSGPDEASARCAAEDDARRVLRDHLARAVNDALAADAAGRASSAARSWAYVRALRGVAEKIDGAKPLEF